MKNIMILLFAFLILTDFIYTQNLKWNGELRIRSELDNRDFRNNTPPNYFTLFRARLGAEYVPVEKIKFYFQVQDSRVFGEEKDNRNNFNTISNTKNLDLHQAYIQVEDFLINNLMLKVGRQRLRYSNERLVGIVNWNNIGRVFDGGLMSYKNKNHQLDIFLMNLGETNIVPTGATPEDVRFVRDEGQLFSGIHYSNNSFQKQQFEFYTFHQLNRKVTVPGYNDLSRFTSGIFGKGNVYENIFYEVDLAYQYGWKQGVDISASLVALTMGYEFKNIPLSSFSLSFERLSGTKSGDSKYKTFDPPYGSGHKFYGYMDYFINIPLHTYDRGLIDIFSRADFKITDAVSVSLLFHNFNLAEKFNNENELGQELDLVAIWRYNEYLFFEAGGGLFFPGEIMQRKYSGFDVAQWCYFTVMFLF